MKKILVTGGTGLVGSHLVAEWMRKDQDCDIAVVAHRESSFQKLDYVLALEGFSARPYRKVVAELEYFGECRRTVSADGAWSEGPDLVYHCAAKVKVGTTKDGERMVNDNVETTQHLLSAVMEHAGKLPRFVFVSSVAALGSAQNAQGMIDEDSVLDNFTHASAYARSKFLSEGEVWKAAAHGLPVTVVNPSVVLGIASPQAGFWFPELVKAVKRGLPCWIDGGTAFVDATDVARALVVLGEDPQAVGKRYLLSAANLSYREFMTMVRSSCGKKEPWLKVPGGVVRLASKMVGTLTALSNTGGRRFFDGSRISRSFPFEYMPIGETIDGIVRHLDKNSVKI